MNGKSNTGGAAYSFLRFFVEFAWWVWLVAVPLLFLLMWFGNGQVTLPVGVRLEDPSLLNLARAGDYVATLENLSADLAGLLDLGEAEQGRRDAAREWGGE